MITEITSTDRLDTVFRDNLAVLLKHSTRCPISRSAKKEFERFAVSFAQDASLYIVDVIDNREISEEIEKRTGVAHQSPQVLVLKNGNVV